ncbi:tRNA lysidine(34) synthetase TilS [Flavobacterium rhizosphaerae]|uniref:tRNA(Ile)-lysidine synthase n=1 Tax=Flavobacterium rhizosphaerae TaxID=3163298 RepID=A0ABW8YT81_9FLAO
MLLQFQQHLSQHFTFLKGKKLFIAVSGGIDSMTLLHLFMQLDYEIAILHCNFNLRGEESNGDEAFVKQYAQNNKITVYNEHFDTEAYAQDYKVSIQIAARELRYEWFYEQLEEKEYDYIITAHNADDVLETFLINLSRGTGIEGLTGIPEINNKIVRPLLAFSRKDIEAYAKKNNIKWREDSSNASDKYLRNKIRHHISPVLKELNPSFLESFQNTRQHLKQVKSLADDAAVLVYKKVVNDFDDKKIINIKELTRLPNYKAYLYTWLNPLGFTAWTDIYNLVMAQPGKYVLSNAYRILKDRDTLIIEQQKEVAGDVYPVYENDNFIEIPLKLTFTTVGSLDKDLIKNTVYVNKELIKFPLFVRKWTEGDYFYPFGMKGQKKKVSKYFKDEKLSLSDKENAWLLCSGNDIIWVIGHRADDRFKVTTQTTQILKIEVVK